MGTPSPSALQVLPAGPVPANLLRWHLVFSEPVQDSDPSAVTLLDAQGQAVPHAFVDLPGGLWDAEGQCLTLHMHPGRIKQGLATQVQHGLALPTGSSMALRVDLDQLLGPGHGVHVHRFDVVEPQSTALRPAGWHVGTVGAGCLDPLPLHFDRPLDALGLQSSLAVMDPEGRALPGEWVCEADGRSASFLPSLPWRAGRHQLNVDAALEDVAGNRIGQGFEAISPLQPFAALTLPFEVLPRSTEASAAPGGWQ